MVHVVSNSGGFGVEWGGSADPAHNLYAWFWAIAEGGTPADADPVALAYTLGCTVFEACVHVAKAERIFRASVNQNRRSAMYQECMRTTRKYLRGRADRLGLRTTGFDTKAELTSMIIAAEVVS